MTKPIKNIARCARCGEEFQAKPFIILNETTYHAVCDDCREINREENRRAIRRFQAKGTARKERNMQA